MHLNIAILGSNCSGKTFIREIIINKSKYRTSSVNIFDNFQYFDKELHRKIIPKIKIMKLIYKIFLTKNILLWKRFNFIKPKLEINRVPFFNKSDILLYEEGLIKKMYEIVPFENYNEAKYKQMLKNFICITPDLLSIEKDYVDGFIYIYSDSKNIISNMKKRNFFIDKYKENILLLRYDTHHILYLYLVALCYFKKIPIILINSYDYENNIIKDFENFIQTIINNNCTIS